MEHSVASDELIAALSLAAGGLLAWLAARLMLRRLERRVELTPRSADDVIVRVLRDVLPSSLAVAGVWLALAQLPLRPSVRRIADHAMAAILVLVFSSMAARLAARATRAFAARHVGVAPSTTIFSNVVRVAVLAIGVLVFLQTIGISITPLLTALGVGGLAVALALQDTLTNLFAGIHILASRKIEPGDYISLSTGEEGYVVDVNWRNTSVRALPDNMILIPNAHLSSEVVTNYHRPYPPMSVIVQVGVSYDSDLEQVERVTIEVASEVVREVPGGVADSDPFVRYHTFGDSSIDFSVIFRAKEYADQYPLKHEFVKRLHRRYREEGIEIPFPIRTVVMHRPSPLDP